MSRNWTLLPLILFLGSTGTLQAQPLDSPDVVYIDGQPCSRACQAYMNWSYRAQSARRHEEREIVAVPAEAEFEQVEPVARPRAAKHAAPVARTAPPAGKTASIGNAPGAEASNSKKIAAPNAAPPIAQGNAAGRGGRNADQAGRRNRRSHSKAGAEGGERQPAGADGRYRTVAARRGTSAQIARARGRIAATGDA